MKHNMLWPGIYTDNDKIKSAAPAGNNQCNSQKSISTDCGLLIQFFYFKKNNAVIKCMPKSYKIKLGFTF